MTDDSRRDHRSVGEPGGTSVSTATLVMGLVFLLISAMALVYGLGHRLPPAAFRFGLPVLLIALGLLGLTLNRSPSRPRHHRSGR